MAPVLGHDSAQHTTNTDSELFLDVEHMRHMHARGVHAVCLTLLTGGVATKN